MSVQGQAGINLPAHVMSQEVPVLVIQILVRIFEVQVIVVHHSVVVAPARRTLGARSVVIFPLVHASAPGVHEEVSDGCWLQTELAGYRDLHLF